jgi:hypothetical protein
MSGEHAKREMVTGEKPEGSERRPATSTRKNLLPPSSHTGRVTRIKRK